MNNTIPNIAQHTFENSTRYRKFIPLKRVYDQLNIRETFNTFRNNVTNGYYSSYPLSDTFLDNSDGHIQDLVLENESVKVGKSNKLFISELFKTYIEAKENYKNDILESSTAPTYITPNQKKGRSPRPSLSKQYQQYKAKQLRTIDNLSKEIYHLKSLGISNVSSEEDSSYFEDQINESFIKLKKLLALLKAKYNADLESLIRKDEELTIFENTGNGSKYMEEIIQKAKK